MSGTSEEKDMYWIMSINQPIPSNDTPFVEQFQDQRTLMILQALKIFYEEF
jgi:hypothetical protein